MKQTIQFEADIQNGIITGIAGAVLESSCIGTTPEELYRLLKLYDEIYFQKASAEVFCLTGSETRCKCAGDGSHIEFIWDGISLSIAAEDLEFFSLKDKELTVYLNDFNTLKFTVKNVPTNEKIRQIVELAEKYKTIKLDRFSFSCLDAFPDDPAELQEQNGLLIIRGDSWILRLDITGYSVDHEADTACDILTIRLIDGNSVYLALWED